MTEKNFTQLKTDVLVVGGGASGVCAALQAARMSVNVVLIDETEWLGGMLSAAGVSAIDGNHKLPSGLWGEFREKLYDYYGGPHKVKTGWVSNTLFEPHVANDIFHKWLSEYENIKLVKGYWPLAVMKEKNTVLGGQFISKEKQILKIEAKICIDATDYCDFLYLSGCDYRIGRESQSESKEKIAPSRADDFIQDLTYVAILKDFGEDADKTITKPPGYNPDMFARCFDNSEGQEKGAEKMLDYGRLPGNKYMINWPEKGNDYKGNLVEKNRQERAIHLEKAKLRTLQFVYYIQTELGFKNLGLADDEFPTADKLAIIPYIRESRRLKGQNYLTINDLVDPYADKKRPLYQQAIAVGDYPIDHHHTPGILPEPETFPAIPSFSVPFGCMVPIQMKGILVAEKSISVTHIVNGATRLQPVVMQIGQAAGAAAALCVKNNISAERLNVRDLQKVLISANCWLMPFVDITPSDKGFQAVQRVALCGLLKGEGKPSNWANRTFFYPDKGVTVAGVKDVLNKLTGNKLSIDKEDKARIVSRIEGLTLIWHQLQYTDESTGTIPFIDIKNGPENNIVYYFFSKNCLDWIEGNRFNANKTFTRKELAMLIDTLFKPFDNLPLFAGEK